MEYVQMKFIFQHTSFTGAAVLISHWSKNSSTDMMSVYELLSLPLCIVAVKNSHINKDIYKKIIILNDEITFFHQNEKKKKKLKLWIKKNTYSFHTFYGCGNQV